MSAEGSDHRPDGLRLSLVGEHVVVASPEYGGSARLAAVRDETGAIIDARVLAADDRIAALLGASSDDLVGRTAREILPGLEPEWIGRAASAAAQGSFVTAEAHFPDAGRWLELTLCGLDKETLAVSASDITERKLNAASLQADIARRVAADEAVRESEARYRTLFEAASDAIYIHDLEGKILQVNLVAADKMRMSREELIALTVSDVDVPQQGPEYDRRIMELRRRGQVLFESEHRRGDGTSFPVEISSRIIDYEGGPAVLSVVRDITERKAGEAERDRLLSVLERSLNEIYLFDPESLRFEYVNHGALLNLGYSIEEMRAMTPLDIKPEFTQESFRQLVRPLVDGERDVIVFETMHRRADGEDYPVDVHLQLVEYSGRKVFLAVINDITERRAAEEALRQSEEQFRAIFDHTAVGIVLARPDGSPPLRANKAFERMIGRSLEKDSTWTVPSITHPDDRERDVTLARELMSGERDVAQVEKRYVRPDGRIVWANLVMSLTRDADGTPQFVIGMAEDITERRAADEARRRSEEQFRAIFENAAVGVALSDVSGTILRVNQAFERITGRAEENLLGKNLIEVATPEDDDLERELVREMLEGARGSFQSERRIARADGRRAWGSATASVVHARGGEPVFVITMIEDVTERRLAEEEIHRLNEELEERVQLRTAELMDANERLRDAQLVKDEFLANMSHELRTPLNSIIGFSGVMLAGSAGPLTEEERTQLGMIQTAGKHLLALINDILDVSSIETGRMSVQPEDVDIAELMRSVCLQAHSMAAEKGVDLVCHCPQVPMVSHTDPTRVNQIMTNLINNAIKFTDAPGSVHVATTRDNGRILMAVQDTGPGIEPDEFERIFERFYQVRHPVPGKATGTGLGLNISRRLAHMLGGEIEVASVVGEGSTFTLWIPESQDGDESG